MSSTYEIQLHESNEELQDHQKSIFNALWDKIAKAEKSLDRAKIKQNKIISEFNEIALPAEESFNSARAEYIQHLLSFLDKKSLSATHKEQLSEWIDEELGLLYASPFRGNIDFDALANQFDAYMNETESFSEDGEELTSEQAKEIVTQTLAMLGIVISDATYDAKFKNKASSSDELLEAIKEYIENLSEDSYEEDVADQQERQSSYSHATDHGDYDNKSQEHADELSLLNEKPEDIINKLYKRLAQKLHPDKALNDEDRVEKNEIMLQLGKAKKEKDLYAFLNIIKTHASSCDVQFSENQFHILINSLQEKLYRLNHEKREIRQHGSVNSIIFDLFNGRSKKDITAKILNHKENLEKNTKAINKQKRDLKNIKCLREALFSRNLTMSERFFMEHMF